MAKALNLRPGIALTAEQVANLTTDIVWIEEQTITLADGGHQVEFKYHPATSPEKFEVDLESLDKVKVLK